MPAAQTKTRQFLNREPDQIPNSKPAVTPLTPKAQSRLQARFCSRIFISRQQALSNHVPKTPSVVPWIINVVERDKPWGLLVFSRLFGKLACRAPRIRDYQVAVGSSDGRAGVSAAGRRKLKGDAIMGSAGQLVALGPTKSRTSGRKGANGGWEMTRGNGPR